MQVVYKAAAASAVLRGYGDLEAVVVDQVLSVNGKQQHQRLYPGAYHTIDVSGLSRKICFLCDVDTVVLERGGGPVGFDPQYETAVGAYITRTQAGDATAIAGTTLDFSNGPVSCEMWASVENHTGTNWVSAIMLGSTAGQLEFRPQVKADTDARTMLWRNRIRTDSANATLIDLASAQASVWTNVGGISSRPIHMVFGLQRGAGASSTYRIWCNTALVVNHAWDDSATTSAQTINMTSLGAGTAGVFVGGAATTFSPGWPGRIYEIRFYKHLLTDAQIALRNQLGPTSLASDSATVSWRLSFNNRASWASKDQPQAYDGSASAVTTLSLLGSATDFKRHLKAFEGGALPSPRVDGRGLSIPADTRTLLSVKSTLVVYNNSTAEGTLQLTEVVE